MNFTKQISRRAFGTLCAATLLLYGHTALAEVTDVRNTPAGIECSVDGTRLRISFITDSIVRVTATRNRDWSATASMMRADLLAGPGPVDIGGDGKTLVLRSPKMAVQLDRATGALAFLGADGRRLLAENGAAPRTFDKVDVFKSTPDPATVKSVKTVDGERQSVGAYVQTKDRDAWRAAAHFRFGDKEALYGLGFDETADLNLRGKSKRLYQHNLRVVIPFVVSTRGYGLLFDSYSAMTFADGKDGGSVTSDVVDDLDYYFVLGPTMDGAVAGYRQLTGAAAMLPKWAFGYIQSRERYTTQAELVDTARQFRDRKIPLDVIVQDWNYWSPDRWGSFVPDATRYPDIAAMTKAVHDMHARVMISIWPNPSPLDAPGKDLRDKGYTSAGTDYVDFFQPKAGDAYFGHVWQHLGRHGIDAWWSDSTEPEVADWGHDPVRAPNADEINVRGLARVIDPQFLNAYALADSRSFHQNWRKAAPDKRLVNLTRSGYAGSQTTGAVVWTGDISATWPVLAQQVAAVQSYSASGTPYVSVDVGAFFVKRGRQWFWAGDFDGGVADLGYRELYTRWQQFGAFLPMLRSHGTDTPREPWQFGEPGTPFYDAILDSIRLRYRFLPYLYSQAGLVHRNGASFIRPLAFAFPDDPRTHDLKSQMLFGDGIIVSPVLTPMYYGPKSAPLEGTAKTRDVYLPKGTWFDFWTGQAHSGGRTIKAAAPLSRMPIHVRAGSVIPMGPAVQYADENVDAPIELRVYPGADGTYTHYEDAGDGLGYERGEYALTPIRWNDAAKTLTIGPRQGAFPGMKEKRRFKLVVVSPAAGLGATFANQAREFAYDGKEVAVSSRRH